MTGAAIDVSQVLSEADQAIYDKLKSRTDVSLKIIYRAIYKDWPEKDSPARTVQMAIGPYLARMNARLEPVGLRVGPGEKRRTYRLLDLA